MHWCSAESPADKQILIPWPQDYLAHPVCLPPHMCSRVYSWLTVYIVCKFICCITFYVVIVKLYVISFHRFFRCVS